MSNGNDDAVASILKTYQVPGRRLYIIGSFDAGVTVLSQQKRALNLVWALVQSHRIPTLRPKAPPGPRKKIAIVGGGFAGLTLAAGLLKKGADAAITIFEERDTLLPLQQGCDSRWLHPRIYYWPEEGSTATAAMLPVLNWTAARASDVVVHVLGEWKRVLAGRDTVPLPTLYCNTRHLQVHDSPEQGKLRIEWVGESRQVEDATISGDPYNAAVGSSADFDIVFMAVGFGLEPHEDTLSYWRNEMIGQPSLDQPRRMYLVSGQGDGAMIDLLRLRISQFRQDRILDDLFADKGALRDAIISIHKDHLKNDKLDLFKAFENLASNQFTVDEFKAAQVKLTQRLRRDTEAILHLKVRRLGELFETGKARKSSFQNKPLIYLLYKCGGFVPTNSDEVLLIKQHKIPRSQVIRRHGTRPEQQLQLALSEDLYKLIYDCRIGRASEPFLQTDELL
jgi:FAD dependent oxidoreductase